MIIKTELAVFPSYLDSYSKTSLNGPEYFIVKKLFCLERSSLFGNKSIMKPFSKVVDVIEIGQGSMFVYATFIFVAGSLQGWTLSG